MLLHVCILFNLTCTTVEHISRNSYVRWPFPVLFVQTWSRAQTLRANPQVGSGSGSGHKLYSLSQPSMLISYECKHRHRGGGGSGEGVF